MVPEAPLERTENGLVPRGDGWFVLNARDAVWAQGDDVSASCELEGEEEFGQVGIFLRVHRASFSASERASTRAARAGAATPWDEVAIRHGAGVEEETADAGRAYARFPKRQLGAYRKGWLPG